MPDIQKTWAELTETQTQVLICDLQEEMVARSKTTPPKALAEAADVLCREAELFGLPLTLSVVPEGGKKPKLIKPLKPFASTGNQLLRTGASPFLDGATVATLAASDRRTLIVAGFATEVVVLHAALDALRQGYGVIVAVDACGGQSERTESAALRHIRDAGGMISSVTSIATALAPDFTSEKGQRTFGIVQKLRLA